MNQKMGEDEGRGNKGLSQATIHEKSGLSPDTIRKINKREVPVDESSLHAYAKVFSIELIKDEDYIKPPTPAQENKSVPRHELVRQYPKVNLPRQRNEFIGRETELHQLLNNISLEVRAPIITVDGIGGVGKTALILEAAYLCLEALHQKDSSSILNIPLFESIIFASAKDCELVPRGIIKLPKNKIQSSLQSIFYVISITLDEPSIRQASEEDQMEQVYSCLAKQNTLLIVDNFETIQNKDAVISFLEHLPSSTKAVITTRERETFYGCMRLGCLSKSESIKLLQQQAQEKEVTLTDQASEKIYARFGGIPVALIYIIGRLAFGRRLPQVLDPTTSLPKDIAQFCFSENVQEIRDESSYQLLMAIAFFHRGPSWDFIIKVAGLIDNSIAADEGLAKLQKLSLISLEDERYRMLPLTREYTLAELIQHPTFEEEARDRWVQLYLDFCEEYGGKDWEEWHKQYDRIATEWKNIVAVLEWCARHDRYKDVKQLWSSIDQVASLYGYWKDRLLWLTWILEAAERRGDLQTAVEVRSEASFVLIQTDKLQAAESLLAEGWKLHEHATLENRVFLAEQFAFLRIEQNQYKKADLWLKKANEIKSKAPFTLKESKRRTISELSLKANIFYKKKEYDKAANLYQEIINLSEEIGWQRKQNSTGIWLAKIRIRQGKLDIAEKIINSAIPIAERNKSKGNLAHYLSAHAELEKAKGNTSKACISAKKAEEGFSQLGMKNEINNLRLMLPSCHLF